MSQRHAAIATSAVIAARRGCIRTSFICSGHAKLIEPTHFEMQMAVYNHANDVEMSTLIRSYCKPCLKPNWSALITGRTEPENAKDALFKGIR